jgi:hypothetical protein
MPVPIPDLRLDEEGMSCTLSFNRTPFFCVVPWPSVYAMVGDDGRGMVWPDDVPPEVASQARGRENEALGAKRPAVKRPEPAKPQVAAAAPPAKAKKPRKRRTDAPNGAEPETRARAGLVAVPSMPQKKAHEPAPQPSPQKATAPDGASQNPRAIRVDRRPATSHKPKRELPPYLRVVK